MILGGTMKNSSGYRIGSPTFAISSSNSKVFSFTQENTSIYPVKFPSSNISFLYLNGNGTSILKDALGQDEDNTDNGALSVINSYPKQMLENLLLVSDANGYSIPLAGTYFTKLLDHTPGELKANSAIITDENFKVDIIRCGILYADEINGASVGSQTWTDSTPTTETVGGITAGSDLTGKTALQILEDMLYAYQTVAFTSFSVGLPTTVEIGNTIGGGNFSTSWNANNSSNIVQNGIGITYSGITSGTLASGLPYSPTTLALNHGSYTSNTVGSNLTFTVRADQLEGNDATRNQVISWRSKVYVGKSEETTITNTSQLNFGSSQFITSSSSPEITGLTIQNGAGKTFILIHSSLNNLTSISIGTTDQTSAFELVGTSTINNGFNESTYKVYRSFNQLTGSFVLNLT